MHNDNTAVKAEKWKQSTLFHTVSVLLGLFMPIPSPIKTKLISNSFLVSSNNSVIAIFFYNFKILLKIMQLVMYFEMMSQGNMFPYILQDVDSIY